MSSLIVRKAAKRALFYEATFRYIPANCPHFNRDCPYFDKRNKFSDHSSLTLNLPFKDILQQRFEGIADVWSENVALFKRLMKIYLKGKFPQTTMWIG